MNRNDDLHRELDRFQKHLPSWAARLLETTREPSAVWLRVPSGIVLIVLGIFGFLPILGFWMVPLGLALLAVDLPFMRAPLARLFAFVNRKLGPS